MRPALLLTCSLLLVGCQSIPEKPVVELGLVDYPKDQILVKKSDGSDKVHREPLSTYDRATCFQPDPWKAWKTYVKLLEQYAATCKAAAETVAK